MSADLKIHLVDIQVYSLLSLFVLIDELFYIYILLFQLPTDMTNYMEYYLMGSVKRIQMRKGCLPSKFECQTDRKKRTSCSDNSRSAVVKRKKLSSSIECQNLLEEFTNNQASVETQDIIVEEGICFLNTFISVK